VRIQDKGLEAFNRASFRNEDLPNIFADAKQHMGITVESARYSEKVLRIEICGPGLPQLTLVDLPGFYDSKTDPHDAEEAAIVDRLAAKYMKQENSIILAVVSAEKELGTQRALQVAEKHDPSKERTLGIITKPDRAEEDSDNEQAYLRLAENEHGWHRLGLGWHVLRNRSREEMKLADDQRDEVEASFFRGGPWSIINPEDRGAESLREKCSGALFAQIQRQLPELINKIERQIKRHQARLQQLGRPLSSPAEVRNHLASICVRFQQLALDAVQGNYLDGFFGGLYSEAADITESDRRIRKLRALVRDMNRAFYYVLESGGERRKIQWRNDAPRDSADTDREETSGRRDGSTSVQEFLQPLINLYKVDEPVFVSVEELSREIEKVAPENQGVGFPGSPNDSLAIGLFRDQSKPWKAIAAQHVELVSDLARSFAEQLILHVTGRDSKTAKILLRNYIYPYFDRKTPELHAKVAELLRHYEVGYDPLPLDDSFHTVGHHRRDGRTAFPSAETLRSQHPVLKQSNKKLTKGILSDALSKALTSPKNEFSAEQIIDNMSSYYEVFLFVPR